KVTNDLNAEQQAAKAAQAAHQGEIDRLNAEVNRRQDEITQQRTAVETAQENVRKAQDQAEAYQDELKLLRTQLAEVQKQANEFKLQQTEQNDRIRLLDRELEVAKKNNKDLREQNNVLSNALAANGLSFDP